MKLGVMWENGILDRSSLALQTFLSYMLIIYILCISCQDIGYVSVFDIAHRE